MRMLGVVGCLVVVGCGPSRAQREAEVRAHDSVIDLLAAAVRFEHACDDGAAAARASLAASQKAIDVGDLIGAKRHLAEADAHRTRLSTCRALLPSESEKARKMMLTLDAWVDTCLECATGKACIAATRSLRAATQKMDPAADVEHLKIQIEALRPGSVCSL